MKEPDKSTLNYIASEFLSTGDEYSALHRRFVLCCVGYYHSEAE